MGKKKDLFVECVTAFMDQADRVQAVNDALVALCPDNQFFDGSTYEFQKSWESLMKYTFSAEWMEYVWWWMYEAPKDSRWVDVPNEVSGDTDRIWITSVEDLYDFCKNHVEKV